MDTLELRRRKDIAPYDPNYANNIKLLYNNLYDNFMYTMDTDLCGRGTRVQMSGHIIKYNCYSLSDIALLIGPDTIKPPAK